MQIDLLFLLNRFIWLFSLAICLTIFSVSVTIPYQDSMAVRRGRVFVIPLMVFFMNALHLMPGFQIDQVYWLAETWLLLVMILAMNERNRWMDKPLVTILVLSFLTVFILQLKHEFLLEWMNRVPQPHYFWFILIPSGYLYGQVRKNMTNLRYFMYGAALLAGSYLVHFFGQSLYMPEVSVLLRTGAYVLWGFSFLAILRMETMSVRHELAEYHKKIDRTAFYAARKRETEIVRNHKSLLENAKRDGLTGAFNRISIMDMIQDRIQRQKESSFSLLMFDIDKFKKINDQYGHVAGDKVLKQLSTIAQSVIRDEDRLGRYGGDEFIILLPTLNLPEAQIVAERLRQRLQDRTDPAFTISIGIAVYPQDGETVLRLIEQADQGLYKSKEKGGNAVSHVKSF